MYFIGIDIAKHDHVAAVVDDSGTLCAGPWSFKNDAQGMKELAVHLAKLKAQPDKALVAMEATGHYWMATYTSLIDAGWKVAVINPVLIDAYHKTDTLRKTKTDALDATLIARFAREKQICATGLNPETTDALKHLTRYREHLVEEKTMLKNRCTSLLDRVFPEFASLFSNPFGVTAKALLKYDPTPTGIKTTDIRTLTRIVVASSHGRFGQAKAKQIKEAATHSIGVDFASGALAFEVRHIVELIEYVEDQIGELEEEIARILDETQGKWLVTIPGIGETLAAQITAEIGAPERFAEPSKLIAYAGLDATRRQSGKYVGTKEHMSKRGSSHLRRSLMLAAEQVSRKDPYFKDYYLAKKAEGKHHYVALSGVARKLAGVILVLMKEQRAYEPRPSIQSSKAAKTNEKNPELPIDSL